jgi:nitrogen fixation/metabolism regulation signal transduction histidine kinase
MIAHQWRQPLSVINTIMATMKIKEELNLLDKETTHRSFKKIEETVSYLSHTIDDFRDYFKPNKVVKEISVTEIVKKSTAFLLAEIKLLDIKYIQNIDKTLTIQTYQNELIQCLINILKNSIDAFKENPTDAKRLTLAVEKHPNHISLHFSDNAGGIDQDILNRIYEPYFSTKAKNGTGLGLYMTKTIIEEHLKGKITITSKDKTTDTLIELPYNIK